MEPVLGASISAGLVGTLVGYALGRRRGHERGHHAGRLVGREEGWLEADAARPKLEIRSYQFTRVRSLALFRRRSEVVRHELWVNGMPTSLQSERELASEAGVDEKAIDLLREVARVLEAIPKGPRIGVDVTARGPERGVIDGTRRGER